MLIRMIEIPDFLVTAVSSIAKRPTRHPLADSINCPGDAFARCVQHK